METFAGEVWGISLYLSSELLQAWKEGNNMLRKLMGSIREYKKVSLQVPIYVTGEALMECIIPFIIARLVNQMRAGCGMDVILKHGAVLLVMAMFSLYCAAKAGYTCATASCGFAKNLRKDLFAHIQTFSFENIDKFSTASLVTRLTTDVTNVQNAYMMLIRSAIRSPLMILFSFIMAVLMGGKMAGVFVVVAPVLAVGLFLITRKTNTLFRRVFRKYDVLNNSIQENVMGMRVVKSYVRQDYEKQKFERAAEDVCTDFTKAEKILALSNPLMQLCMSSVMVFVLYAGSYLIITTQGLALDVGQFSSLLTYNVQILNSLMLLSMMFVMVTMAVESAQRIVEVLSEESSLTSPPDAVYEVKDGSIDFEDVSFKYAAHAEKMVLSNVNLHIRSGETIGIIGGTGSSKSSLIQLISRLYDVTEGAVKVGGVDVRRYDLDTLRNQVSVVLQKNVLFSGTIKENMRWGNQNATDEEIKAACVMAHADEFVTQFPDGYDTYIEQGGTNVSGGQKQRLCIARALLKNPKILILDDSTSAVDTKTDSQIRQSLREMAPELTKIIIAQRVSSVQDADRIIVLESGKVQAVGTHQELLESSHIYHEVYESQNQGGEQDEK